MYCLTNCSLITQLPTCCSYTFLCSDLFNYLLIYYFVFTQLLFYSFFLIYIATCLLFNYLLTSSCICLLIFYLCTLLLIN
jgi:hypothetical protein